jgi:hypothetical protein
MQKEGSMMVTIREHSVKPRTPLSGWSRSWQRSQMQVRRNLTVLNKLLVILTLFERRNYLIFADPPTRIPHFVL